MGRRRRRRRHLSDFLIWRNDRSFRANRSPLGANSRRRRCHHHLGPPPRLIPHSLPPVRVPPSPCAAAITSRVDRNVGNSSERKCVEGSGGGGGGGARLRGREREKEEEEREVRRAKRCAQKKRASTHPCMHARLYFHHTLFSRLTLLNICFIYLF